MAGPDVVPSPIVRCWLLAVTGTEKHHRAQAAPSGGERRFSWLFVKTVTTAAERCLSFVIMGKHRAMGCGFHLFMKGV